jgi:apolipoprotein N-acyltransferase
MSFYILGSQNLEKFNNQQVKKLDYKVRILSSNISIDRFYNNIDPVKAIEELIEISSPKKNEKIIYIWPEGIIPGISQDKLKDYKWLFENKFNESHLLAIGINSKEDENKTIKYFNSLSIFDHNLNIINSYKKINLVPFGEFLPFEKLLKSIGFKTITNDYQSYSKGEERNIIDLKYNNLSVKILPLICYEIIYSGKIFTNSNFDYIVNISEDGWFGKSIGPEQHFTHSIFRAIESGKYVLRSANNGTTAIINPMGVIEQKVEINKSDYIDLSESRKIEMTIFTKFGNKIFGFIILLYIFLIFSFKKLRNE